MRRNYLLLISLLLGNLCLAACGEMATPTIAPSPVPATPVIIGSKLFTENVVVAEIYAQALENAGIVVQRKLKLGPTDMLHPAIQKGEINLYPDYTGTAYYTILQNPRDNSQTARTIYEKVAEIYPGKFKLIPLDPAPMNNTYSLAVSRENAERYNLRTMSDLAPKANLLRFISIHEWVDTRSSTDGLKAFQAVYGGYDFKGIKEVVEADRYKALLQGDGEVVLAYTTDGEIAGYSLVLLADDKNFFPPYQIMPIVRESILATYPNIKTILNTVSARLTSAKITTMNWKIDGPEKADLTEVARNFLKTEGLVK